MEGHFKAEHVEQVASTVVRRQENPFRSEERMHLNSRMADMGKAEQFRLHSAREQARKQWQQGRIGGRGRSAVNERKTGDIHRQLQTGGNEQTGGTAGVAPAPTGQETPKESNCL